MQVILKVLLVQSAFEKVSQKAIQKYNEGFNNVLEKSFRNKDDIAYLQFSDNHNIEQYPKVHKGGTTLPNHNFYYIKGSKNYETLRLAFIDPKSRIMSPDKYNSIDTISNKIEKLKIENEPKIESNEIYFSPHLNVIIGGRSSGKSLLMNILGKKIDRVDIESHYKINENNFLIKSKADDDFKVTTSISDNLIYINQGDIVRYFEENDLKTLAEKSDKVEAYAIAKKSINQHKENLKELINTLLSSYSEVVNFGTDRKYELHQSTINNFFSSEYTLKYDIERLKEENLKSDEIEDAKTLLEDLLHKTTVYKNKEIYEFNKIEIEIIENFLELLKTKESLITSKYEKNLNKLNFINDVNEVINTKNSSLNQGAQEKVAAQEKYETFISDIGERFKKLVALKNNSDNVELFNYEKEEEFEVSNDVSLILSVEKDDEIKKIILDGINNAKYNESLYINMVGVSNNSKTLKRLPDNSVAQVKKKLNTQLDFIIKKFEKPKDYLKYADGSTSKENSPGLNSENYLKVVLKSSSINMIFIDQPEDNLGNRFISHKLVDIIRNIKFKKQIFLVTHNPAIAVYGDAECIIIAENNDNTISYKQIVLENKDAQKEICSILDGGEYIFDNRSRKYNIQRILREA